MTITDAKAAELRALCEAANLFWDEPQTIGKNEVMRALLHTALTAIPALLNEREELIKERDCVFEQNALLREGALYVELQKVMRAHNAAITRAEKAEAEIAQAFAAEAFHWSDTKHVRGTSVVPESIMLLAADGRCIGLVNVLQCETVAVFHDVERALASASNPAKIRRFMIAARNGEAEANDRAETAESALTASLSREKVLREALEFYADQFCEHSTDYEGCGKLSSDECSGCKARAALNASKKETSE